MGANSSGEKTVSMSPVGEMQILWEHPEAGECVYIVEPKNEELEYKSKIIVEGR